MPDSPRHILIFGGTFDLPHIAHTILPPLAAKQLGCERIIYIPAAISPLKLDSPPTQVQHRLAMLRLAVRSIANAEISTIEIERAATMQGPSYTVDTLEALAKQRPEARMHLLIGADQALSFHKWKSWERILELATPAVMLRPPWKQAAYEAELQRRYSAAEAAQWRNWTLDLPWLPVSATEVRDRLERQADVRDLVDPKVLAYITQHRLYGTPAE